MIFGPNSPNTAPPRKPFKSNTIFVDASTRNALRIALGISRTPFCHHRGPPGNPLHVTKGRRKIAYERYSV